MKLEQLFVLSNSIPTERIQEMKSSAASCNCTLKTWDQKMGKLRFFLFCRKLFKMTHPMDIKKPHTNMEMLPAQLFLWLYGSLRDPNLLPIISAMPRHHDVKLIRWILLQELFYVQFQNWHATCSNLPSPPHIIDTDITPTGESRQKARALKISIKT